MLVEGGETQKCGGRWSFYLGCPYWASSNSSITVQVSLPWHWFPQRFLFLQVVILCIHLLSSDLGDTSLPCDMSLRDLRIIDFSVCSVIGFSLGQSGNFQASYKHAGPETRCPGSNFLKYRSSHSWYGGESDFWLVIRNKCLASWWQVGCFNNVNIN